MYTQYEMHFIVIIIKTVVASLLLSVSSTAEAEHVAADVRPKYLLIFLVYRSRTVSDKKSGTEAKLMFYLDFFCKY